MMSIQKKSASAAFKALLPVAVAAICAVTFADCNSQKESLLDPVADHNWAHTFSTEPNRSTIRVVDDSGKETTIENALGPNAVYIVDGERVENFNNVATETIASIQVYKGAAAAKWTSDPDAGVMIVTTKKAEAAAMAEETFYEVVEDMPEFPGGDLALRRFIAENVRYPQDAKDNNEQGTVYVKFIVDKTGKVTEPTIVKGSGCESLDEEAIRVVNTIPDFTPGRQRGQNVAVSLVMPIKFALEPIATPNGNEATGIMVIGE